MREIDASKSGELSANIARFPTTTVQVPHARAHVPPDFSEVHDVRLILESLLAGGEARVAFSTSLYRSLEFVVPKSDVTIGESERLQTCLTSLGANDI